MDDEKMKGLVIDAMSDFYNEMLRDRFDRIDKSISAIGYDITDLKLSQDALVKIVDYSKLQDKLLKLVIC